MRQVDPRHPDLFFHGIEISEVNLPVLHGDHRCSGYAGDRQAVTCLDVEGIGTILDHHEIDRRFSVRRRHGGEQQAFVVEPGEAGETSGVTQVEIHELEVGRCIPPADSQACPGLVVRGGKPGDGEPLFTLRDRGRVGRAARDLPVIGMDVKMLSCIILVNFHIGQIRRVKIWTIKSST